MRYTGKEESFWRVDSTSTDFDGNSTTTSTDYRGENVLYSNFTVLHDFPNGAVARGHYSFPFVLRLHNYLPGSFREEGVSYSGRISYRLRAQVAAKGEIVFLNEREVIIKERPKEEPHAMYGELSVQPTTCCCIEQGRSSIRCFFQSTRCIRSRKLLLPRGGGVHRLRGRQPPVRA